MAVSLDEFLSTGPHERGKKAPPPSRLGLDEFLGGEAAPQEPPPPELPPAIGTGPSGRRAPQPELLGGPEEPTTAPFMESLRSYPEAAVTSTSAIPSDLQATWHADRVAAYGKRIEFYQARAAKYPEDHPTRKGFERWITVAREQQAEEQRKLEQARDISAGARAHLRDITPKDESTLGQMGRILAESAPPVIAGVGTFVATRSPALSAAVGGGAGAAQQVGATTTEALERGAAPGEAVAGGLRAGFYEFAGEYAGSKIVFKTINKVAADAALSAGKKILTTLGVAATSEGASELLTQLAQDIDTKFTWNPDLTWEEIRRNAALATGAGALGGVLFGGAATGAVTLAQRARISALDRQFEEIAQEEMARRLAKATPAERVALESTLPVPPARPTGEVSGAPYTGEPIPSPLEMPMGQPPVVRVDGREVTPGAAPLQPPVPPISGAAPTMAPPFEATPMPAPPVVVTRSIGDQLSAAIQAGEGAKFVSENVKTLEAAGVRPATTAAQLYARGRISKEQAQTFIKQLTTAKMADQVEAELRLDSLDKQLKVIDDFMRSQAEEVYKPLAQDERELKAINEALSILKSMEVLRNNQMATSMTEQGRRAIASESERRVRQLVSDKAGEIPLFRYMQDKQPMHLAALARDIDSMRTVLTAHMGDVQSRLRGEPVRPGTRRRPQTMGFEPEGGTRFTDEVKYSNRGAAIGTEAAMLKPGEVGASVELQPHLARQIITLLDRWIKKVMPEASVFVVVERRPNYGGHQTFYRGGKKVIVIAINPEEFGRIERGGRRVYTLNPRGISILAHELGHGIARLMFHDAPAHVREALIKAWQAHVMERLDKTLGTYLDETRGQIGTFAPPGGAETLRELFMKRFFEYIERGGQAGLPIPTISVPGDFTYAYWTNMDEWFAHNMERMLEADYAEMSAPIKTFFRRVFNRMKSVFEQAKETGRLPNETFEQWIKAHKLRADARATEATIDYLKNLATQLAPTSEEVSEIDKLLKAEPQVGGQPVTPGMLPKLPPWAKGVIFTGLPTPVLNNLNFDDSAVVSSIGGLWRGTGVNQTDAGGFDRDLDRFSKWKKWTYTLINVARINPHIKELWNPTGFSDPATGQTMYGYIDYVIRWANERMQWMESADKTLRLWRKLPTKMRDTLARFMLDQTVEGQYFNLTDPGVLARYPLSPEAIALFKRIDGDYKTYITAVEETLVSEAQVRLANNPMMTAEIRSIRDRFAQLKDKPYFPLSRFGKYTITVRAARDGQVAGQDHKAGDTLYFSTYDWAIERDLDFRKVAAMYPGQDIQKSRVSETVRSFAGIPTPLIEALKTRLNLTEEQREALNNYLYEIAPGQAFVKHLIRRKNTPGFSWDAERAYANYFLHGSNHLARLKYRDLLADSHKRLVGSARAIGTEDATKRMEIANYIADHLGYIMNPENDWAAVRGAIAVSYLGGMLKTAWVNMTQVPMVTYPELARQHGDTKAIAAITRAYTDLLKMYRATRTLTQTEEGIIQKWINGMPLTPSEESFIQGWSGLDQRDRASLIRAQQEGFIDQSFAMELAGVAGGGWLSRFHTTNQAGHYVREFTHALMVPFEMGERINRRVTFIAALRLARATGVDENTAYLNARQVVYDTQYEYSRWNRPQLLQGKKGIIFMFMQYVLNTLFFAGGGANKWYSAWRWWAMMLMAGGLMGLPFADNLKDLAVWAYSKFQPNKRLNVEYELKKLLTPLAETLGWSPDIFLHGASRYGFGLVPFADLSGSMSMGRIVPATDVLAAMGGGMKWNDAMTKGVTEAGGATSALVMRMLKAAASDDPDTIRRVEQGMPFSLGQSMMTAMRWYQQGGEETWNGERIVGFDPNDPWQMAEILGKGLFGLQPRALSEGRLDIYGEKAGGYDARRIRQDFAHFYAIRRQHLLEQLDYFKREGDSENVSKTLEEIRNYNQVAPASARLQGGELRRSLQQRERARRGGEAGTGASKLERGIAREIREGGL